MYRSASLPSAAQSFQNMEQLLKQAFIREENKKSAGFFPGKLWGLEVFARSQSQKNPKQTKLMLFAFFILL